MGHLGILITKESTLYSNTTTALKLYITLAMKYILGLHCVMLREADSLLYCASLLDIKIVKECHETMKLS